MSQKKEIKNFINGESVSGKSGQTADLINPTTGEVFASAPISNEADIDLAFKSAAKAFETWKESTPSERSLAMFRIADLFEEKAEELVAIESENTGKPIAVTMAEEIGPMVDQIRYFATAARNLE
ncbi:MAG: aldehyde dehydrogenase family protein, partial [Candidatus Nanopelagicales bacterium]